jgi:hypothetical protein
LAGANVDSCLLDRIDDSPAPSFGSLGRLNPLEYRAACGAWECVPVLAGDRLGVEGAAEIVWFLQSLDLVERVPRPVER